VEEGAAVADHEDGEPLVDEAAEEEEHDDAPMIPKECALCREPKCAVCVRAPAQLVGLRGVAHCHVCAVPVVCVMTFLRQAVPASGAVCLRPVEIRSCMFSSKTTVDE